MKQKLRKFLGGLALHLVVSGVALGGIRVYQQGYNTTHREQLQMASLTVQDDTAELQFLGKRCVISTTALAEDSMLYYAAYFLTGGELHLWMYVIAEFINRT